MLGWSTESTVDTLVKAAQRSATRRRKTSAAGDILFPACGQKIRCRILTWNASARLWQEDKAVVFIIIKRQSQNWVIIHPGIHQCNNRVIEIVHKEVHLLMFMLLARTSLMPLSHGLSVKLSYVIPTLNSFMKLTIDEVTSSSAPALTNVENSSWCRAFALWT